MAEKDHIADLKRRVESGQSLGRDERACLRAAEKAEREQAARDLLASFPTKVYREVCGLSRHKLDGQSVKYRLGIAGTKELDLGETIHRLHAVIDSVPKSQVAIGEDLMSGVGDSVALERYRNARADLAEIAVLERQGVLLPRDATHDLLTQLASLLRGAGERLLRDFGEEPAAVLASCLDAFELHLDRYFQPILGDSDETTIDASQLTDDVNDVAPAVERMS